MSKKNDVKNYTFALLALRIMKKNTIQKIIAAILFLCWMGWIGHQLRQQEIAIEENDKAADLYFEKLDSLKDKE